MPNVRPISTELAKLAATELNEDPARIDEDLAKFREWIKKQPQLRSRTDDQFLITFLRGCKYSLERCKEKLDLFYSVRNFLPEIFLNRNPRDEIFLKIVRLGIYLALPETERPDSPRVFMMRMGAYEANEFTIQDICKAMMMSSDLLMYEDDNMAIAGQMGVLDLKNVTLSHIVQYSPAFIKQFTPVIQEASPLRLKGFHYINMPKAFEVAFNLFKSLLSEKNRNRLIVHQNMESLYKHVPQRLLPKEYGGEAGTIIEITDEWEKKMSERVEFFKNDAQYGVDEKRRIGEPNIAQNLYGVDGTFRKFNVD